MRRVSLDRHSWVGIDVHTATATAAGAAVVGAAVVGGAARVPACCDREERARTTRAGPHASYRGGGAPPLQDVVSAPPAPAE
jgi:hypothetical protein